MTTVGLASALVVNRAVTIAGNGMDATTLRYTGAASDNGAVLYLASGPVAIGGLTIADGKSSNTSGYGGGLSIHPTTARQVTLDRVHVLNNRATGGPDGGIYASNVTLAITDSVIEGNQASKDGGGLYLSDATGAVSATLTNTVVSGNSASSSGGGIDLFDDAQKPGTVALALTGSTVGFPGHPNTAQYGGGIGAFSGNSTASTLTVTGSTIADNVATSGGGGLTLSGPATTITNSAIARNGADTAGGIFGTGSTLRVTNSTIAGNTATD